MGDGATADTKVVRGVRLRRDPAREECFTVVHIHRDMHEYEGDSDVSVRQRVHRHMHNEMQSLEIAAKSLADFPDAPWGLRMELARQCWDETRHTLLLYRQLRKLGGHKGEFPVMNYEWGVTCMMDSLPARLALQNRTFEGGEMDLLREQVSVWREHGDEAMAEVMDGLLADEVQHVRYANQWFRRMSKEDPRVLLQLATAVSYLKRVTAALAPQEGEVNAVGVDLSSFQHLTVITNVEDRLRAGFTEAEVAEVLRQETAMAGPPSPTAP